MRWGKVDYKQLKRLQQKIEKLEKQDRTKLCEETVKEMAARMLAKLIKKTPVGVYSGGVYTCAGGKVHKSNKVKGKTGGTLRKGWTVGQVVKNGNSYSIEIINPTEYASYVNNGHRTRNHKGWVEGHFFIEISEKELEAEAQKILEKKIQKYLEECFDG